MPLEPKHLILEVINTTYCWRDTTLQTLWSGYGSIDRYRLEGAGLTSVIVKHVSPPTVAQHPRGWNTDRSHQRKLKSYRVESTWYQNYAHLCDDFCRVPKCHAVERDDNGGDEVVILLEDLDASGFSARCTAVTSVELSSCLVWLAEFHASFMGSDGEGLWETGTYWHLETRPDELERLATEDPALHRIAKLIDQKLKASPFQTLVHGDAKLANFCFSPDATSVAAVDFQYVGRGCGMKDVAYFIGSCLNEEDCQQQSTNLLDCYFAALRAALKKRRVNICKYW